MVDGVEGAERLAPARAYGCGLRVSEIANLAVVWT
jgi:hypothetical protein